MKSVLTICLSPTFQKTLFFEQLLEGEVNRAVAFHETVAGKGINVARTINNLGMPAVNLCQLGEGRLEQFLSYVKKDNLNVSYIKVEAEIRTCTTLINRQKGTTTELVEEAREVEEADSERLFDLFKAEVEKYSAVVISGTKAKGFAPWLYPEIVKESKKRGKLILLDIKGAELISCLEQRPDIIKPNLSEFATTFMKDTVIYESEDDLSVFDRVSSICADIYEKYGTRTVLTRGKYDSWVFDGKNLLIVPALKSEKPIINTVGCGDTLTGALVYSLLNGKSLENGVSFGMERALDRATQDNGVQELNQAIKTTL